MDHLNPEREVSVQEAYLDEHGREKPNPVPLQPAVGYKRQPTIAEQMRMMIRQASVEAAMAGAESEEEANDFDVGEDMEPHSPWENDFEPDPALDSMLALASRPPEERTPRQEPKAPVEGSSPLPPSPSGSALGAGS